MESLEKTYRANAIKRLRECIQTLNKMPRVQEPMSNTLRLLQGRMDSLVMNTSQLIGEYELGMKDA